METTLCVYESSTASVYCKFTANDNQRIVSQKIDHSLCSDEKNAANAPRPWFSATLIEAAESGSIGPFEVEGQRESIGVLWLIGNVKCKVVTVNLKEL